MSEPLQPYTRRAIYDDRIAASVFHTNGSVTRWGPDEIDTERIPADITFSDSMPGGFKSCTITLPRRIDEDYEDLNLLDTIQLYLPNGDIVWEGRITELPRSQGTDFSIRVGAVGWQAHLADLEFFKEIYIDRDLGSFSGPSSQRMINQLGAGNSYAATSSATAWQTFSGGAGPALLISYTQFGGLQEQGEYWYDAKQISIGKINYDFIAPKVGGDAAHQSNVVYLCHNPLATEGVIEGTDHHGTAAANQSVPATGPGYKAVLLKSFYTGSFEGTSGGDTYGWTNIAVIGNHGLTVRGSRPTEGFYASDIVADAVQRAAPLLEFTTGINGTIQETQFAVPHASFREGTTAQAVIETVNAYHLWDYAIWEERTLYYGPTEPERLCWEARLGDGASLDFDGDAADQIYNGVVISFTTGDGETKTVGPIGSGADTESSELEDTNPENPVNAHSIPQRWAIINFSLPTFAEGAIQLGRVWLAEHSLAQRRGSLVLTGLVDHPTAGRQPVSKVRSGHYVSILSGNISSVPRRIISKDYSHKGRTVSLGLDNTIFKLDALLERGIISLQGRS